MRFLGRSLAIAMIAVAALAAVAGTAVAVFPPLYQQAPAGTQTGAPPQVTPTAPDPPVVVGGTPTPPTTTTTTPEPATIVTGIMGMMLAGGYVWRKRRQ